MANETVSSSQKSARLSPLLLSRAREMRQHPAPAEEKLWRFLRDRQLANLKFRRQVPMGQYVADFYCAAARVVIELDGPSHLDRIEYDAQRSSRLADRSIRVVRFGNHEVHENLEGVLLAIASECGTPLDVRSFNPHPDPLPSRERGKE